MLTCTPWLVATKPIGAYALQRTVALLITVVVSEEKSPYGCKPGGCRETSHGNRMVGMAAIATFSVDYLQSSSVDSHSMGKPSDLVQGTLDLLILKTISLEPMHGWAIAKRIQQISNEVLQGQQGSLYPTLHRLQHQAWIPPK